MPLGEVLSRATAAPHQALQAAQLVVNALGGVGDRVLGGPIYAQIGVSDACNHRCTMCEYHPPSSPTPPLDQFGGKRPGLMSMETFRQVVNELAELGTRRLDIVGRGEPMLHPDLVAMIRFARQRGFTVSLTTNGSCLDGTRAEELVASGLDRLRVSLNAARAETYPKIHRNQSPEDYRRICEDVRRLCDLRRTSGARLHVAISFVVEASNFRELVDMVEAAHRLGADAAHFQHNVHTGHAADVPIGDAEYAELTGTFAPAALSRAHALGLETDLRALKAAPPAYRLGRDERFPAVVPCYVGSFFTSVLGNGQVMACCQTQEAIGSVADGGFTRVWRGERYGAFRRAARRLPVAAPELSAYECDRCFFRPHNVAIHNALHPLGRIGTEDGEASVFFRHFLRLSQLERDD